MVRSRNFLAIAFLALAGCSLASGQREESRRLDGFGGVVLGSSFEDALTVVSPTLFNPYGLKECDRDMPVRGCFLSPESDFAVFRRIEGIPYALQLDFNRLGALTDITLRYNRGRTYDQDLNPVAATITEKECRDILTRTVDWVTRDYDSFVDSRPAGAGQVAVKTAAGNSYWMEQTKDRRGYVANGTIKMPAGRTVALFSHFLLVDGEPDCFVSVSFRDSPQIERRPEPIAAKS